MASPAASRSSAVRGRDEAIGLLRGVVDEALDGRGVAVLITGEAGIGKTTVLAEAARYAQERGARTAWGFGHAGEGAPGFWPWLQALRELDLGDALMLDASTVDQAPAAARFQLFDVVTSALLAESRVQPVVLLFDDLHTADPPSLALLEFLLRRLPTGALAVLGSARDEPEAGLAGISTLRLPGLDATTVTGLVGGVLGPERAAQVGADVHRRTGGNPFLAQQVALLLSQGGGGVPPGARQVLEQRFAGLDPAALLVLGAAAVAGTRARTPLLAAVVGDACAPGLAAARRAGVLIEEPDAGVHFVHDLLREYAYERLSDTERARLHGRVGEALLRRRDEGHDVAAAELAEHFVRADPVSARAYGCCVDAARHATRSLAYEEAVRHWQRAAQAAPDRAARLDGYVELAAAQRRCGLGGAAAGTYAAAAELARQLGDTAALARAALGLHAMGTRAFAPRAPVRELLEEAAAVAPAPMRARVLASLARELAWRGVELSRARELAEEAVAWARSGGDPATLASCLLAAHNVAWGPASLARRRELIDEVLGLAAAGCDAELLVEARLLSAADRWEAADPSFRGELAEFLRLAEATGQPRLRYAALVRRATLAMFDGRLQEAEGLIEQARAFGTDIGEEGARDVYVDQIWELRGWQGRRAELLEVAAQLLPDPDSPQATGLHALLLLAAGERAQAARVAAPLLASNPFEGAADGDVVPNQWLLDLTHATELVAGLGAARQASVCYEMLAPFAHAAVLSGAAVSFKGCVAHHLGVLAATAGRPDLAAGHLNQAVVLHERLGAVLWAQRSRSELAALIGESAVDSTGPVLRRDGPLWTIVYGGMTVRVRDAKGLRDLATLLAEPHRAVAAVDLVAARDGEEIRADLGLGADEVLDATARRRFRARLTDLAEEIDQARGWSDPVRAQRAQDERDALVRALAGATGLGGRARRLGDQHERARKAVTGRIRDAIARIAEVHPALGTHLTASVSTGNHCVYAPAAEVTWRIAPG